MEIERQLVEFMLDTKYENLPKEVIELIKTIILGIIGATFAGAQSKGCKELVDQVREWGGREESTILIYGGKVPACNAAMASSAMARASNLDEALMPGLHIGSCSFPTALATAELVGGCNGKEFLTSLVLGSEVAARINSQCVYNGYEPTGVCGVFATAGIAGMLLDLNMKQLWNALALAFIRSGGSFQVSVDKSLGARIMSGFACQGGIACAQLAQKCVDGPKDFLEGTYGYFHFYAPDNFSPKLVTDGLGERFEICKSIFKKYPSCATTTGCTEAILGLIKKNDIIPEDVAEVNVKVTPRSYRLVGGHFEIGDNPSVNAQYNIQYCVANALLRRTSRLHDFDEVSVRDPRIMELVKKIHTASDSALEQKCAHATVVKIKMKEGTIYSKSVDIPQGYPENPLNEEQHMSRFQECISYAEHCMGRPLPPKNIDSIISQVNNMEEVKDVCDLIPMLLSPFGK